MFVEDSKKNEMSVSKGSNLRLVYMMMTVVLEIVVR